MGIFQKMIERYTEPEEVAKAKEKPSFFDQFFEDSEQEPGKTKKTSFFDQFFEQPEEEVNFANTEAMEEMAENLSEQIRKKRKDLKMIGMSVTSVKLENIAESKEIAEQYVTLLDEIEQISNQEKASSGSVMETVEIQRKFHEFERKYEEQIPRVKSLYLLSELIKQNNNMKREYDRTPAWQLTRDKLQNYKEYIQKISIQQETFPPQLKRQLMNELITAEYRLKILILMRNSYEGKEEKSNPFSKDGDVKKQRYEEMFLEDLEELSQQYERITILKRIYIESKQYTEEDFNQLDESTDELLNKLSDGFIDDFSVIEIFGKKEYRTLQQFIEIKMKLNAMEAMRKQLER